VKINANGIAFNVLVEGPEGAPWVTFCNSLASDLHMWDFQAAALKGRYRLLRYDRRGHGRTPAAIRPGDWRIADLAADVLALWDALKITRSHYVGCSIGGMTGMALALDHPARIGGFVCADSRSDAPAGAHTLWTERIAQAQRDGMAAMVESTLSRWFTPEFLRWNPPVLDSVRAMIRETSLDGYEGCANAVIHLDLSGRLKELRTRTLFVVGAEDPSTTPAVMKAMHQAAPGSSFLEIAGSSHLCNVEQPERFNRAMIDFLAAG
jgi:3-oxoadipate enol-lactonase